MSARGSSASEPFNPVKVSPSRVNALLSCGKAFEMKYIQHLPEQQSGAAALFGSVVHEALEHWCVNRDAPLVPLMRSAWLKVTEGTVVRDFIGAYQALSVKAIKEEARIRAARPDIKVVRMTKDWKTSAIAKSINSLLDQWGPKLAADSPWKFREPKLGSPPELPSLYDESLIAAKRYEARWRHLPPAFYAEFGFDVKWEGFILNGYIDAIEPIVSAAGELEALAVLDYKTYAKEPAAQKDWRQTAMYDVAIGVMCEAGTLELPDVPLFVGVDYFRLTPRPGEIFESRRLWEITQQDRERLLAELTNYKAIVEGGHFMPADKSRNVDWCPYPEACCLTTAPAIPVDPGLFDQRRPEEAEVEPVAA